MFSKHLGIKDSNEAEMMAILEALCIYRDTFQFNHIVENDSINACHILGKNIQRALKDAIFLY